MKLFLVALSFASVIALAVYFDDAPPPAVQCQGGAP
jgi:hypothetical protein